MIQVTMQFDTLQSLHDFTAQFAGGVAVGAVDQARITIAETPAEAPKKRGSKPKTQSGPDSRGSGEPDMEAAPVVETATVEAKPATIDDVRAVLQNYNSQHGFNALKAKLKEVAGCDSMKGIKPTQYGIVVAAFKPA